MRRNFLQLPEKITGLHLPALPGRAPAQPKPAKSVRRVKTGPADRLALTEVRANLTFTATTVTAWYTLAEQVWAFRYDGRREALLEAIASQYASLAGLNITVRRTSVPFDVEQWARALADNARPLPDDPMLQFPQAYPATRHLAGPSYVAPTWGQHLTDAMGHLMAGQYTFGRTQLGVTFARPGRLQRSVRSSAGVDEALAKQVDEITEDLAAAGLAARPSTPDEVAWLIYRSVGVGLMPPAHLAGDIGPDDIGEFIENVDFVRGPYSSTTQVTDRRTGEQVHVAVLTVGRMEAQEIPQIHQPWAHLSEQADFPTEWSSRVGVLAPALARGPIERRRLMMRSQQNDYADHNLDSPLELDRLSDRAAVVVDEIDTGLPAVATRVHGWHRVAVAGATADECLERSRALIRLYEQSRITLVHPKAQPQLLREFIPGEPTVDTGYIRRMPVKMFAAAMPQATAIVGDNRGDLIGVTAGAGTRPVFFDPHYPMEVREKSGLAVFCSEPGGGKSTLMGALGYLNARRGVQVTLMDPSGPLARLCDMPELRRHARVVDLVGSQPGTLAPYALIPTPHRAVFPTGEIGDREYATAVAMAQAERSALALDICQMLLPAQALDDSGIVIALREAVMRRVPAEETSTMEDVGVALDDLAAAGNVAAKTAAGLLFDASRMPLAQLFFGRPAPGVLDTDAALTVITMGGLRLPDLTIERKYWSGEETLAVPMLHLAGRLAVRRSYTRDMHARKFVGLDEAHFMQGWGSGRAFLTRLARDSRKWNIAALVASQNPRDILELDVQNLVSTVFVGRIADDLEIAEEALRLLRVPTGVGYEATLAGLSQHADTASSARLGYREFVMRDVDGRVQKIRIDVGWVRDLLTYLDTTPGGNR